MSLIKTSQSKLIAPIVLLTGHEGTVTAIDFQGEGRLAASSSTDGQVLVWNLGLSDASVNPNGRGGEVKSIALLQHKRPVTDLKWSREECTLYSVSTDHHIHQWNTVTGERVKKYVGHSDIINSCDVFNRGIEQIATVSDDRTCRLWSSDEKYPTHTIEHAYPVLSVAWSKDGQCVFSAGINHDIQVHDVRNTKTCLYTLKGHVDSVTGMSVSNDGSSLVSTAMDNTVKVWDIKPFSIQPDRLTSSFNAHGFEKNLIRPCFSKNNESIACGSADRTLTVWNLRKQRISYKLPGHKGCVNAVAWHPHLDIVASGSTDKTIYLGELNMNL